MSGMKWGAAYALAAALAAAPASADVSLERFSIRLEHWTAVQFDDGELTLARTTLAPSARFRLSPAWRLDAEARLEFADDDVGLGSLDGYSSIAQPLIRTDEARLEIDRLTLTYRRGPTNVVLGKQSVAWGVLDGLQVTDRFDAIRRRDFVLTDIRPDRLSRWGVRARTRMGETGIDFAVAFDPTVSQLAEDDATFAFTAPRFRGGLPPEAAPAEVRVATRDDLLRDATVGLRLSRSIGVFDVTALVISGPDTDPVLQPGDVTPQGLEVILDHPRRELFGVTVERGLGQLVLRFEAAYVPDQPVNVVDPALPLSVEERSRFLAGVGLDWEAPGDVFVNAQLGVDHIADGALATVRPETDVIGTLRLHRDFLNDTVRVQTEYIGSLSDGDGVIRPSVEWRMNDTVTLAAGVDAHFGDSAGQFGQFDDASRAWLRVTATF